MQTPLDISYRHMDFSEHIEADIRDRVDQLERRCDWIIGCHVTVEAPHHQHRKGNLYHVRIRLTVPPRREITVSHESRQRQSHEDVHVAIRDAFRAARKQLTAYVREIRANARPHEVLSDGILNDT